jgi:hypothetical protein
MLELKMDSKAFGKLGMKLFFARFLPLLLVMVGLAYVVAVPLRDHIIWVVVLIILELGCAYKLYRLIYKSSDIVALGKTLKLTVSRDGATGTGLVKKELSFTKSEVISVTIEQDKNGTIVSFAVNRQRKKVLGRVNYVAYEYYITAESELELKKFFATGWNGTGKTKVVDGKEKFVWRLVSH